MKYYLPSAALAVTAMIFMPSASNAEQISSPSGNITVKADVVGGKPTYSVDFKGKTVINP